MIRLQFTIIFFLLFTMQVAGQDMKSGDYSLTVAAGSFDRTNAIVSFSFPDRPDDGIYLMRDSSGNPYYLQVEDNKGRFILKKLNAGASETYTLSSEPFSGNVSVQKVTKETDSPSLKFKSGDNEILGYFYEESDVPEEINPRFRRAGYIHPVYTPGGVRVTQDFNPGRPHQYGIWSAWSRTEFQGRTIEFWAARTENGRITADTIEQVWEGPVYGGFRARHRFIDFSVPEPVTTLNEQWEVFVYQTLQNDKFHIFDIDVIQTANTGNPVNILEHVYGGISFRGHDEWDGEGKMNFISSEGYDRSDVSGQRVRWSHMGGYIGGKLAGIGLFGHPDNINHPHGVFINQTEPFFSYGPAPFGDTLIEPGSPWVARYRIVTHDGEPDPEELERMWNDYAYPPAVTVIRND